MTSLKQIKLEPPGECGEVDTKPWVNLEQCAGLDSNIESIRTGKESSTHSFTSVPSNRCPLTNYKKPMCECCGKGMAVHMVTQDKGHHQKCCMEVSKKALEDKNKVIADKDKVIEDKDLEIGLLKAQLHIIRTSTEVTALMSPGQMEDLLGTIRDKDGPSTSYTTIAPANGPNVGGDEEGSNPGDVSSAVDQ